MASVSHGCELMLQPAFDQTLLGVKHFRVIYDGQKSPSILSLNSNGAFVLISRDAKTGEAQVLSLSQHISLEPEECITTFAVSQDLASLKTYLACVSTSSKTRGSRLHVFRPFNILDVSATGVNKWLVAVGTKESKTPEISQLLLGRPTEATQYPFLAAVVTYGGRLTKDVARIEVNAVGPTSWEWSWAHDLTFPFNMHDVVDFCVGSIPIASGIFALHRSQGHNSLTFAGLSSDTVPRSPVTVTLPVVDGAQCLATTTDPLGFTNIIVGGNGFLHISAQDAVDSVPQGTVLPPTVTSDNLQGLQKIVVAEDGDDVVMWVQNSVGNLIHQRCQMDTSRYHKSGILGFKSTSPAVPLLPGNGSLMKFDVLFDSNSKSQKLYLLKKDGSIVCMFQAGDSLLWSSQSIRIPDPENFEEVPTYTCQVRFTSTPESPTMITKVNLSSSSQCTALVNGCVAQLSQAVYQVELDEHGGFVIVITANDLTVPTFTLSDYDGPQTYSFQPATNMVDKLSAICASGKLRDLRKADGSPLLSPSVAREDVENASQSILKLQASYNSLSGGDSRSNAGMAIANEETSSWDFWHGIACGVEPIVNWIFDAGIFVVETSKGVWRFLVEGYEQVLKAMGEVMGWIGARIDDLLVALASFLDWESIMQSKAFLREIANIGLDIIVELVAGAGNSVDKLLQKVEKDVGTWHIPPTLPSELDRLRPGEKQSSPMSKAKDSPVFNWGFNQMKVGGRTPERYDTSHTTGLIGILEASWRDHIKPLAVDIQAMLETLWVDIKDLFDLNSSLSWQNGLKNIGADLVLTLVKIFRRLVHMGFDVVMKVFEWLKEILNASIHVPILSRVYRRLAGNDLSVLDLFAFIWAIPTTYVCKWVLKKKPGDIPEFQQLLKEIDYRPPIWITKSSTSSPGVSLPSVKANAVPSTLLSVANSAVSLHAAPPEVSYRMQMKCAPPAAMNTTVANTTNIGSQHEGIQKDFSKSESKGDSRSPPSHDGIEVIIRNSDNWTKLRRWWRFGWLVKDALALAYTTYDTVVTGVKWPTITAGAGYDEFNEMLGERPKWKAYDVICAVVVCLVDLPTDTDKSSCGGRVIFWLCTSIVNVWKSCMPAAAKIPLVGLSSSLNLGGYLVILALEGIFDGRVSDSSLGISHRILTAAWGIGSAWNAIYSCEEPYGFAITIAIGTTVDRQAYELAKNHGSYWLEHGFNEQYNPPSWSTSLSGSFIT